MKKEGWEVHVYKNSANTIFCECMSKKKLESYIYTCTLCTFAIYSW